MSVIDKNQRVNKERRFNAMLEYANDLFEYWRGFLSETFKAQRIAAELDEREQVHRGFVEANETVPDNQPVILTDIGLLQSQILDIAEKLQTQVSIARNRTINAINHAAKKGQISAVTTHHLQTAANQAFTPNLVAQTLPLATNPHDPAVARQIGAMHPQLRNSARQRHEAFAERHTHEHPRRDLLEGALGLMVTLSIYDYMTRAHAQNQIQDSHIAEVQSFTDTTEFMTALMLAPLANAVVESEAQYEALCLAHGGPDVVHDAISGFHFEVASDDEGHEFSITRLLGSLGTFSSPGGGRSQPMPSSFARVDELDEKENYSKNSRL